MKVKKRELRTNDYVAVIIYSIIIVAFAQFNLDILVKYFMVSMGILLLPLFLTIIDDFPLMQVSVVAGLGVSVSRALTAYAVGGEAADFATAYLPEAFFYIIYGLLLFFYFDREKRNLTKPQEIIVLTFIDYVANMMELVLREGMQSYTFTNQVGILAVGFVRALMVFIIIKLFNEYKVTVIRHEDVRMYKKLLMTVTELSNETICMKENMDVVEDTMSKAYKLYDNLKKEGSGLTKEALSVATNVHEIKKSYNSVLRGISAALEKNIEKKGMYVSEIVSVLLKRTSEYAAEKGVKLTYSADCPERLYSEKYYYLMSLFNNIFTNAVEAAKDNKERIDFSVAAGSENYIITVSNDGKEIPKEICDDIFTAGYSTKINYETGVVGRGLGLLIVKNIVEDEFGGRISVHSNPEKTSFIIEIPKERMEMENEDIHS